MNKFKFLYSIIGIISIFLIWEIGNYIIPEKVPKIYDVISSLNDDFINAHLPNLLITAKIAVIGLFFALLVSLVIVFIVSAP